MTAVSHRRPEPDEYGKWYSGYVASVPETDILAALEHQIGAVRAAFDAVPANRADFRYAAGKWSVRELAGHLNDGERVFSYRALRFSRGDETPLPGFDENDYVAAAPFSHVPLSDLVAEFEHQRRANVLMFRGLGHEAWARSGVASGNSMTVRALAYVLVGHVRHHLGVLQARYL